MTAESTPLPGETTAGRHRATLLDRFWAKVDKTEGCWNWTGARSSDGYGTIYAAGKTARAHRVSYELFAGPIPDGMQLDHLCRNIRCVNPAHLEPVTGWVNSMRGFGPTARNARKTHCPEGHPYNTDGLEGPGRRRCAPCALAANKAWKAKQPKRGNYLARREACKQGHAFDEENTFVRGNGSRGCRTCANTSSRLYQERKRRVDGIPERWT